MLLASQEDMSGIKSTASASKDDTAVSKETKEKETKVVVKVKAEKPRKVINMHHKPALSNRQREQLRSQPFKGINIIMTHFIIIIII